MSRRGSFSDDNNNPENFVGNRTRLGAKSFYYYILSLLEKNRRQPSLKPFIEAISALIPPLIFNQVIDHCFNRSLQHN